MSDKTGPVADFPELTESKIATLENSFRARRESLLAVDEAVERLTTALGRIGQLDNTVILFTSDNGFMQGQHRWTTKVLPYEESIRVPLVVRGPGFPAGQNSPALASNVDLPATLLKATGVAPRRPQEGVALQELLSGKDSYANRAVLLERGEATDRIVRIPTYTGVRTTQYTYISWADGGVELYDNQVDPFQLDSVHADPPYAAMRAKLAELTRRLSSCAGSDCVASVPRS